MSMTAGVVVLVGAMLMAPPAVGADDHVMGGFEAPVSDFDVTPDGSIVAVGGEIVQRATPHGAVTTITRVDVADTAPETTLNGVAAIGRSNLFVTSGGGDQGEGATLWRVSPDNAREVADIEAFETAHDPDASDWKDVACEAAEPYTAGPQTNPYHVEATSGGSALIADAAGNSILDARTNGTIDWLAILTPPLVEDPTSGDDYRVLFSFGGLTCYVQPVPTSVDMSPDGNSVFVGELMGATGLTPEGLVVETGLSRVWRIDADAHNAVCSEDAGDPCEVAVEGLTSVIDVAFGPDGLLYVAEFDRAGWFAPGDGGAVLACDVSGALPIDRADCDEVVAPTAGVLVDAISFDKWGGLWILQNGLFSPEVRRISP